MIDAILNKKNAKFLTKITVKSVISIVMISLSVAIPQIVHLIAGSIGGVKWLPMYMPVILTGCLLGSFWGMGVGLVSPVISYLFTLSNPMPALIRLPYMMVELMVFGLISGLFSKKITKNAWVAFPAVLLSQVIGRSVFICVVAMFQGVSSLSVSMAWTQINTGLIGMFLQAIVIPFIVILINYFINKKENKNIE